ncbi:Gfo/Idh/MocA family protein [Arthrobacter sp. HY1533]|uniref:Gfo/Idh/MocA family protein n=1 Tax=Arthrobacter sp. HY1533 TaxID=2970919 RepID=UPI0022BA0FDA|nr:Gfo/Idh/MocA family oxidoreductase [Arthrobacter sp. HY1533]
MTQLRVGLIGAGGIAGVHITGWQQLGAQVSVYSRSGAAHLVQKYGVAEAATLQELLEASDVICILTPTTTHHGYAMAAIAAGKDIVCEKPLAENAARAADIAKAAADAGVRLFPAHVVRFFPEYLAAHHALETSAAPAVLRLSRASAAPAAGSWFFDETVGGGIIRDQMIHDIDQARWLAGEVLRVHAVQDPPTVDGVVPRPVSATVVLTHENGAVSRLSGEWGPDGKPFSTSIGIEAADGMSLYSWPEVAAADPAGENAPGDYLPAQTPASSPYTLQLAEFAAARASGEASRVTPHDGVMAVALAEAAYASIALGEPVEFSSADVLALLDA